MRSRLLPIGLAAIGCAGCSSFLFPDDREVPDGVRQFFAGMSGGPMGCEIFADDARLVATASDPNGGPEHSWWIAPTEGGGEAELFTQGDGGGGGGGGVACEPTPDRGELWWSGGAGSDSSVTHGGRAPEGSTEVRLTFGDHEPVVARVQNDGYFLLALDESACCEWGFPTRVEAIDPDGDVISAIAP